MANYIPHADLDPYATYHQQPPYPSYHHPVNFPQPPQFPQDHAQRYQHAPQQHQYQQHQQQYVQMPNQAHGHGPPGSMPPPSSIPDNSSFPRQNYAYASAPQAADRWPLGLTDNQRQLQEHYFQQSQTPHLYPNYHQPSPFSGPPSAGPVSTFHPPPPQNRPSPQIPPPSASPRVSRTPPSTTPKPQQPMTATAPKTVSFALPPPPTPAKPAPAPAPAPAPVRAQSTLETRRVNALLELNRVLLEEVVKVQAAQSAQNAAQSSQKPPQTSHPPAANPVQNQNAAPVSAAAAAAATQTPNNPTPSASEGPQNPSVTNNNTTAKPPQPLQPQNNPVQKFPHHAKEYVEYMRRLQANLAYLACVADRNHKPQNAIPPFPAILEAPNLPPPPDTASKEKKLLDRRARERIDRLYAILRDLWPEYKERNPVQMPSANANANANANTVQGAKMGTVGAQAPVTTSAA
ncbi:MAG: hypothetical protein Q9219_003849 [cf. Caloplaca sp. 3 TL-2023]